MLPFQNKKYIKEEYENKLCALDYYCKKNRGIIKTIGLHFSQLIHLMQFETLSKLHSLTQVTQVTQATQVAHG